MEGRRLNVDGTGERGRSGKGEVLLYLCVYMLLQMGLVNIRENFRLWRAKYSKVRCISKSVEKRWMQESFWKMRFFTFLPRLR